MEKTLERNAKCQFKTKMDKHGGFLQVDLTRADEEMIAIVFGRKIKRFGGVSAAALFHELMKEILYILKCRPLVQDMVSCERRPVY